MIKNRLIALAFLGLALVGSGSNAVAETGALDGYWFSDQFKYAFRIDGTEGVAVLSNSPRYSPGQVMLRFKLSADGTLSGEQIFTDGQWVDVIGRIVRKDVLELRGGGHQWRMIRR